MPRFPSFKIIPAPFSTPQGVWKKLLSKGLVFAIVLVSGAPAWAITIDNPVRAGNFEQLLGAIVTAVQSVAIPFAVFALIVAAFRFVLASSKGNERDITAARTMLLWVVVGTAIIAGAEILARVAINTAKNTFQ